MKCLLCGETVSTEQKHHDHWYAWCDNCYDAEFEDGRWQGGPDGVGATEEEALDELREVLIDTSLRWSSYELRRHLAGLDEAEAAKFRETIAAARWSELEGILDKRAIDVLYGNELCRPESMLEE